MIVVGSAVFVLGLAMIGVLIVRGSRATVITEKQFNDAFDALPGEPEHSDADRQAAWREFADWQQEQARERRPWEEDVDEWSPTMITRTR